MKIYQDCKMSNENDPLISIKNSSSRICLLVIKMTGAESIVRPFRKMRDFRDKYEYLEGGVTLS